MTFIVRISPTSEQMIKFPRKTRGHFVTLTKSCMHLTEYNPKHINNDDL